MLLGAPPSAAGIKYAGTFLGALGIYPCVANTISWCANNVEGVYKRGVTLGFVIGWGNLNGIVASNIYRPADKPGYKLGHGVVFGYLTVFLLGGSLVTHFALKNENRKRRAGERDGWVEGKGREEVELLGDRRYVLFPGQVLFFSMDRPADILLPTGPISCTRSNSRRASISIIFDVGECEATS